MKGDGRTEFSREYPCLLRVSDGGNVKFFNNSKLYSESPRLKLNIAVCIPFVCFQVDSTQLPKFYQAYGTLPKSSMATLRKRQETREAACRAGSHSQKEIGRACLVVDGTKRGHGRRKRQRQMKAALKQRETLSKVKAKEEATIEPV